MIHSRQEGNRPLSATFRILPEALAKCCNIIVTDLSADPLNGVSFFSGSATVRLSFSLRSVYDWANENVCSDSGTFLQLSAGIAQRLVLHGWRSALLRSTAAGGKEASPIKT